MICRRCGRQHNGTMMRTNTRYTRVSTMLHEECPQGDAGRLLVCHYCQRQAYFANGFLRLLARDVEDIARYARHFRSAA